ncbi:hypothetical protein ACLI4U_07735 [Natrialbaceae archaeon A-CW2]
MRANRRNVLIGLGTIVAGGGAALGTGAFSTVEAQRTVNVNIIDEGDIADEFVDIILQAGSYDSVGTDDDGTEGDGDGISLVANDVTLVFGTSDNKLPPNTDITYEDLFEIVNDNGDSPDFQVTFDVDTDDGESTFSFDPDSPTVSGDQSEAVDLTLETDDSDDEDLTLTITIEEQE